MPAAPGEATSAKSSASSVSIVWSPLWFEPLDASVVVLEHPSVSVPRIAHDDVGLPPVPAVRGAEGRHPSTPGSWSGLDRVRTTASGPYPAGTRRRTRTVSPSAGARFETYSGEPSW